MTNLKIYRRLATAVFLTFALLPASVHSQDLAKQKEKKSRLEAEIESINKQLAANKNQQNNDLITLSLTQEKISKRRQLIATIDKDIYGLQQKIEGKNREIFQLNERLDTLTAYYESLIYNAYKTRDSRVWFMYIMSGQNISQGVRRFFYLQSLASAVNSQAKEILATKEAITTEKAELGRLIADANKVRDTRSREYEVLTKEESQLNSSIKSLSTQEKAIKQKLAAKNREIERLNKEIERLIAEAIRVESLSKKTEASKKAEMVLSDKFGENKGRLPWPVTDGVVVEPYGQSYHPVFKNLKLPFNNGINISTDADSKALAVFEGVVKQILVIPGYNQCVLIQHGEYYTFYCRLKKVTVKGGDKLNTGEPIGTIDVSEGANTILHFEIWQGTARQNPANWLRER